MDSERFDTLSRFVAAAGTRRGLFRLLTALPLFGALLAVLDDESADARRQGRPRRRHVVRHERPRGAKRERGQAQKARKHKKKKTHKPAGPPPDPGCTPESAARTCAGRCGQVPNNCDSLVDCGSCACGAACPVCQTCNTVTGRCDTNPPFVGQACGLPGQVCQEDGTCTCDDASCADGQRCNGLVCVCDATSCPTGCCDETRSCRIDDEAACGTGGGACTRCTGTGVTCGGGGVPGQCGCTTQGCGAQTCGATIDNCGEPITCSGCAGCCDGNTCRAGTNRVACGNGGEVCQSCDGVCIGAAAGSCASCDSVLAPCPAGLCCSAGACVASCPACQTCIGGACASDTRQNRTTCQLPGGGGTGVCCNGTCCAGCCDATVEQGVCSPCLAFVTSTTSNGILGGLVGADRMCQARAEAGGFWGRYKAWLSNGVDSPSSRFRCTAESCSSMGYRRVDGQAIASNWTALTHQNLTNKLNITELGGTIDINTGAWTNTHRSGIPATPNFFCQNWTVGSNVTAGSSGRPEVVDHEWSASLLDTCPTLNALYCFQQD